ncbi:MAG: PEP/pyruvate-binding domain-containing protein, partial [Candidatus Promineifilaceae bacterium]
RTSARLAAARYHACDGGKGSALAHLYQAGYPVPEGFIILPAAFHEDDLSAEAWSQVERFLRQLRRGANGQSAFAVRSSALSEDAAESSFAGEFETVLDVRTDDALRAAIQAVRHSRHSQRVRSYSQAKGIDTEHDMAVVVQSLVRADISGVLFTADPVSGSHWRMTGNFVYGFGEALVSGEAEPYTFTLERPKGDYDGPANFKKYARRLYKLAVKLEKEFGCPQDIEWAIADGKAYVLQSRPITTLVGHNPVTGEWTDSLTGDYLWSRNNYGEARPDIMTPLTWSLSNMIYHEISPLPGYAMGGNVCGRFYANVSVMMSMMQAMGQGPEKARAEMRGFLGEVPEDLEIPTVPLPRSVILTALPRFISLMLKERRGGKYVPEFLANNETYCRRLEEQLQSATRQELLLIWQEEILPMLRSGLWIMGGAVRPLEATDKVRRELVELVGEEDTNALFSNLSDEASLSEETSLLASLGPVVGIARVAEGKMSRQEYLRRYGHRGPGEAELAEPRPSEDSGWLDRQLADYAQSPIDVDALLAKRKRDFEAAWERLVKQHPRRAKKLRKEIDKIGPANRLREDVRSEITRFLAVERSWALRVGAVTGLGDDIFFLEIDEILALLNGQDEATRFIAARKQTYERYKALPPYPAIIRGRFNAFEWAADPDRRADIYDATRPVSAAPLSDTVSGFPGAAGRVEGTVRIIHTPDEGHRLAKGDILVTVTTNVGWTPLFPRAAAVVTDVGAPLSHAAIVARELGVPAVVGCVDATTRLRDGDRVIVDGGQGTVEILSTN